MNDGGSPDSAILLPALGEPPSSLDQLREALAVAGVAASVCGRGAGEFDDHVDAALHRLASAVGDGRSGHGGVWLIGASYGGMVAAAAAAVATAAGQSPAGLVLLDAPHPLSYRVISAVAGVRARQVLANPEGIDLAAALDRLGRECVPGRLDQVPLLVLARGPGQWPGHDADLPAADRIWMLHQQLWGLLSRRSRVDLLHGVGHAVAREAPAEAVRLVMSFAGSTS